MESIDRRVEYFHQMMMIEMLLVNNNNPNRLMTNLNEYDHPTFQSHNSSNSIGHNMKNHLEMVSRWNYLDKLLFRKKNKNQFLFLEKFRLLGTLTDTFDCRRSLTFRFNDLEKNEIWFVKIKWKQTVFEDDWDFWIDQDNKLIFQNFSKDHFHTMDNYNQYNLI